MTVTDHPQPTTDLDAARADLAEWGYCVVPDVLTPDEVELLRDRLDEQAAGERAAGVATMESGGAPLPDGRTPNQRVFNLVNKGGAFRRLVTHEIALSLIRAILGDTVLLSSLTANIAGPGSVLQPLHMDQTYVRFTPHEPPRLPLVANVGWVLDDVSEVNGGTRFVPGSHLADDPYTLQDEPTVSPSAPAGSAIVFDGRILHGTGANATDARRRVVLAYYCQPFLRQQENMSLSIADGVRDACDVELLKLLGFEGWYSLGRVYDLKPMPEDGLYRRPSSPLTELRADGTQR